MEKRSKLEVVLLEITVLSLAYYYVKWIMISDFFGNIVGWVTLIVHLTLCMFIGGELFKESRSK